MARGHIFEITDSPEELGYMCEDCFYEQLDAIGTDYVKSLDEKTSFLRGMELAEVFRRHGSKTGTEPEGTVFEEYGTPFFEIGRETLLSYFRDRFEKVKKAVSSMSLEGFALKDPYYLRILVHDTARDGVYWNGCFYTLDHFLRDIASTDLGARYYIGNVVYMH